MSEKPEALRLAQEFELHVAFGSGMTIRRTEIEAVAAELRNLHAENERLREALKKVLAADDDPNDELTYIRSRTRVIIRDALRREDV